MKRRRQNSIFLMFINIIILDKILFMLDQTLPILKKDRKIYLRSDSTVFRSNSTFSDQILLIFKKILLKNVRSNSTLF